MKNKIQKFVTKLSNNRIKKGFDVLQEMRTYNDGYHQALQDLLDCLEKE